MLETLPSRTGAATTEPTDCAPARASSPRASCLRALVRELDAAGLRWCVLRGHAGFPDLRPGGDLDLLVHPEDASAALACVERAARAHGVAVWERRRSGFLDELQLYAYAGPGRHELFGIDVHRAEACRGVTFLEARAVLAGVRREDGLPRPDAVVGACIDALGPLLAGGSVPRRHAEALCAVASARPDAVADELGRWLGEARARELVRAIAAGPDFAARVDAGALRRAVLARAFARAPLRSLRELASFGWAVRFAPWWRPRGRTFALLGTDGTGKSTVLAGVLRELRGAFGGARVHAFHLRPGVLPQINALFHRGRTSYSLDDMARPHRARPSGHVGSALRAAYYAADYALGNLTRVLPLRRRTAFVAFDRYAHDWLVDPLRSRMRRGNALVRWLVKLCPQPDRLLVCAAPLELVRARKQELTEAESRLQLELYDELARTHPRAVRVSTCGSIEESVDRALRALFEEPRA